jgi:hypothetical protein
MRFAYADPPYLGCALRLYGDPTYDDLEAHHTLIKRLCNEYPDGWALSCNEPSLHILRSLCPDDTRTAVWVKPFAVFKPGVNPAYAWEPVLFCGGRKRFRYEDTVRDWHSENITLKKGLPGAKPGGFALWILQLLNVRADLGDTIDDLFLGTGGVLSAWKAHWTKIAVPEVTP